MLIDIKLTPEESASKEKILSHAASAMHVKESDIFSMRIVRRSVDARQRQIWVLLTVNVALSAEEATLPAYPKPVFQDVRDAKKQVTIVGAGPAGLFAALTLIEHGIRPIILERGKPAQDRKRDIALLNRNEGICEESNYCFGEGGAGTFSDGKLFSRSKKRGDMHRVLEFFHFFGAVDSVLYDTHAHIGSDRLPTIIKRMRETIIEAGGEIHFNEQVTDIIIEEREHKLSVTTAGNSTFTSDALVLAIGHSAHDTYRLLASKGIVLEPKGFAMGVRVEHPQSLINSLMYHIDEVRSTACAMYEGTRNKEQGTKNKEQRTSTKVLLDERNSIVDILGNAAYNLRTQVDGRGVYSFCMCPGGHIVPAGSSKESIVVNGMSASHRNSPFANSGIVVEIPESPEIPESTEAALERLDMLERIEHRCWEEGALAAGKPHSAIAPAQRLRDFVEGKASKDLPATSYLPGCIPSRLDLWLPQEISTRLRQGFRDFDRKYPGFLTNDAVVIGVESRSSSPIRIARDSDTLQAKYEVRRKYQVPSDEVPSDDGRAALIYPCGEGAGYAGGITSSALDGIKIAEKIAQTLAEK